MPLKLVSVLRKLSFRSPLRSFCSNPTLDPKIFRQQMELALEEYDPLVAREALFGCGMKKLAELDADAFRRSPRTEWIAIMEAKRGVHSRSIARAIAAIQTDGTAAAGIAFRFASLIQKYRRNLRNKRQRLKYLAELCLDLVVRSDARSVDDPKAVPYFRAMTFADDKIPVADANGNLTFDEGPMKVMVERERMLQPLPVEPPPANVSDSYKLHTKLSPSYTAKDFMAEFRRLPPLKRLTLLVEMKSFFSSNSLRESADGEMAVKMDLMEKWIRADCNEKILETALRSLDAFDVMKNHLGDPGEKSFGGPQTVRNKAYKTLIDDPQLKSAFEDPEIQQAFYEISQNRANSQIRKKYAENAKVMKILEKIRFRL